MHPQPLFTAPRDGTWIRCYSTRLRITSHAVRWTNGPKGLAWYGARGERLAADVFDAWLPVKDAAPAWCEVLGVDRAATLEQITAAYRERAKRLHPDVGGSHEGMTALTRARDEALAAISGR
jgi:hypothetical protein